MALIRNSFLILINEKGFEKITINEIATHAQINRSTFYLHFSDKYELLDNIVDEAIENLESLTCSESQVSNAKFDFESFVKDIQSILDIVVFDALFYKAILGKNGLLNIRTKIKNSLKIKLSNNINNPLIEKELLIELISCQYVDTIAWWLTSENVLSSSKIAQQLAQLLMAGAINVSGPKGN